MCPKRRYRLVKTFTRERVGRSSPERQQVVSYAASREVEASSAEEEHEKNDDDEHVGVHESPPWPAERTPHVSVPHRDGRVCAIRDTRSGLLSPIFP